MYATPPPQKRPHPQQQIRRTPPPTAGRPPQQSRTLPPQGRPPITREEMRRRQAIMARRRAAQIRRRNIRLTLCALGSIFLIAFIVMLVRGCTQNTARLSTPEEDLSLNTPETTVAVPVTESAPPETTQETEAPVPPTPQITRPIANAATVTLTDEIDSGYAALIAPERGVILAAKNATARMYPASMTKIMTVLVAYEHIDNLDDTFTVTSAIIDPVYNEGASLAGFSPGETVTLRDLLYGTALPSGAEAAVSLAVYVAGSEEDFVTLMNEKAAELGLTDTHFTNCSGLHNVNHYSTAVEIAMILDYALQYEECATIFSTYEYTSTPTDKHPEGVLMHSTMLSRMYGDEPDGVTVIAGKTGYTPEAGQCLASYATDDETGEAFILVTADAEGKFEPIFDAIQIYSDYTAE